MVFNATFNNISVISRVLLENHQPGFPPSFGHLAKQLQRRRYLEVDQSETRMVCGCHVY